MELPFHLIIEGPTRADPQAARRVWWVCALAAVGVAAAATFLLYYVPRAVWRLPAALDTVQIIGVPEDAAVQIDGHSATRALSPLSLAPGPHRLRVTAPGYMSGTYPVTVTAGATATISTQLWLAQPGTTQLLPPLPGSTVTSASFLQDGRITLEVALPPGNERQLWVVAGGQLHRIGPPLAQGSIAASPDGQRVAYFAIASSQSSAEQPTELWLSGADGRLPVKRYSLPAQSGASQLVDVSWAPDGQHLLLVSSAGSTTGGQWATIAWLDAGQGDPRDLVRLPSDVVSGSETWSPDGRWVAFVALTGNTPSLCLLSVPDGEFRYLGDLGSGLSHPLPVAPATWAPESGDLLYSAPISSSTAGTGWLLGGGSSSAVYSILPAHPTPRLVTKDDAQSPFWLPEGSVAALARGKADGPLLLRQFNSD
ncbi:MAG: PEGA domain-containing protein, partial [Chloroflexota bacterium]|nr:PEGA domain-containing protein [Chloroflexota bacterium]